MTIAGLVNKSSSKTAHLNPLIQRSGDHAENPQDENLRKLRLINVVYYLFLLTLLTLIFNFTFFLIYDSFLLNFINQIELFDVNDNSDFDFSNQDQWVPPTFSNECAVVPNPEKFDCFPRGKPDETSCTQRGCCWSPQVPSKRNGVAKEVDVPWCFYPNGYQTYETINVSVRNHVTTIFQRNLIKSPYPNDAAILKMTITPETKNRVHIVLRDATRSSFETPFPETPVMHESISEASLNYEVLTEDGPGFKIKRKADGLTLFDSGTAPVIFSTQMIQITCRLFSNYVYGLGEHRNDFLLSLDWNRITLFNHDSIPTDGINGYGSHPFLLNLINGTNSYGIFLKNSHPMEIILQPYPAATFRVLGGVLDFYFFTANSPSEVIKEYLDVVGYPFMPPYWSLGFHMCKYGQPSLQVTNATLQRTRAAGIPVDVQWNDLDYMDSNNDFTRNKKEFKDLPKFIEELHAMGMHYIPILDPGVSAGEPKGTYPPYDDGIAADIFIKNSSGLPLVGKVWNKVSTVWPDFTHRDTVEYWYKQLKRLHDDIPFDGLWIDMNEPSNFVDGSFQGCGNNSWDNPPFVPTVDNGHLNYHTVCMNANHSLGKHYQVHNLHGFTEAIASNFALKEIRNKRPFIISRSTFAGQGKFSGHWTGDVRSTWDDMKHTVADLLSFSLFGIPMVGADICGFNGNTTAALCQRWLELGAFYPFSRSHNSDDCIDQDPVAMGDAVVFSTRRAMKQRYFLLPYLYSLFWRAHVFGETVVRPLFFEFPEDERTYNISTQFMWGSALLINPVLKEGDTYVDAYLPGDFWYDIAGRKRVVGGDVALEVPLDRISFLQRPKSIIPGQAPGMTTTESRNNKFFLSVALDSNGTAEGYLYYDDGESLNSYSTKQYNLITFSAANNSLVSKVDNWGYPNMQDVFGMFIYGVETPVKSALVNGQSAEFKYDTKQKGLLVLFGGLKDVKWDFTVTWSY